MTEKEVEAYLRDEIRKLGGIAPKFVCPGTNGMPDRIILLPGGRTVFAETKSKGRHPRPLQKAAHRRLRALGFPVYGCVDNKEAADLVVEACAGMIKT